MVRDWVKDPSAIGTAKIPEINPIDKIGAFCVSRAKNGSFETSKSIMLKAIFDELRKLSERDLRMTEKVLNLGERIKDNDPLLKEALEEATRSYEKVMDEIGGNKREILDSGHEIIHIKQGMIDEAGIAELKAKIENAKSKIAKAFIENLDFPDYHLFQR